MFVLVLSMLLFLLTGEGARAQAPYYQGKTVTLIVGSGAGTAYDIYARLQGNYIGKYLPGSLWAVAAQRSFHLLASQIEESEKRLTPFH